MKRTASTGRLRIPTPREHTLSLVSSGVRARQAWESADLRRRLQELQHEYDEQGSAVSQCDSTYTMMKIVC